MVWRRSQGWATALIVVPFLLLVVSLPGRVLLRCRFDGQVRASCCCKVDMRQESPAPGPSLSGPSCCCDREISGHALPLRPMADVAAPGVPVVLPAFASLVDHRPGGDGWPAPDLRGPPPPRRLIVLKQSFLI